MVAAPAGWVRDPARPITDTAGGWPASATLESVGLVADASASIHRPATLNVFAVATDNQRPGRIVRRDLGPKKLDELARRYSLDP